MGERLGRPLTEEVGRPRVLPNAKPLSLPERVPAPEKKEPVKVLPDGTEAHLRFRRDRAKNGTIPALARFMKIPESEVRETMDSIVSQISVRYHEVEGLGKAQHVYDAPKG